MVKKISFILFILLLSVNSFAQDITAHASVDKDRYSVGDYINYTITVNFPKDLKVYPPFIKDSLKSVTLLRKEPPVQKIKNGRITETYNYTIAGYDSAGVTIPPIPVLYKTSSDTAMKYVATNPVSFTVTTLKVNKSGGIKDVKGPLKIPLDWKFIILIALLIIILAAIAYYFYRRYRKKKGETPKKKVVIKLPPHTAALKSLNVLEEKKLWQQGLVKEYHSEITEIIRKYFEERFNLPAMELTTSEATQLLRQRKEAGPVLDITYNFLSNADMVKFAKFSPVASINEEMMRQAYDIVNKTIPEEKTKVNTEAGNVR